MAGALRAGAGLAIVGTALVAGYWFRSPWIVALLAVSFTALYVAGKIEQWKALACVHGVPGVLKSLAVTLPIQGILCGLFYLVGVGIGALAGQGGFAERLERFDYALAGGLLAFGIAATIAIHAAEARAGQGAGAAALSVEIQQIMDEASDLGQQAVAMPVQIFSLARRLTDHPERAEALAAMEGFFDHENAFVRRVAYTALRFMGQAGRDLDPEGLDRRIIEGMQDPAVWVRYDAAWAAGEIRGDDAVFAAGLREMIGAAEAAGADELDENDSAHKALARARTSLDAVAQRGR